MTKGANIHMTDNETKRLMKIRDKIAEMKSREQSIVYRDKSRQRKAKTRRLIQIGTLTEKYLHCEGMGIKEISLLFQQLFDVPDIDVHIEDIKKTLS